MLIIKSNKVKVDRMTVNFKVLLLSTIFTILSTPKCLIVKKKLIKPVKEPASAKPGAPNGFISKNAKIA